MWRYGLFLEAMERDSWCALVNVAVWAVSSGYGGCGDSDNPVSQKRFCFRVLNTIEDENLVFEVSAEYTGRDY